MMRLPMRAGIAWLCFGLGLTVGGLASAQSQAPSTIHQTPPGLGQFPYSDADVEFMSGMIPHHAQAVIMAPTFRKGRTSLVSGGASMMMRELPAWVCTRR